MVYTKVVIPKDCLLCDSCNAQLTDGNFIATEMSYWYEGWLYCVNCYKRSKPRHKLIRVIEIGDDVSQTDLAQPIVMESW